MGISRQLKKRSVSCFQFLQHSTFEKQNDILFCSTLIILLRNKALWKASCSRNAKSRLKQGLILASAILSPSLSLLSEMWWQWEWPIISNGPEWPPRKETIRKCRIEKSPQRSTLKRSQCWWQPFSEMLLKSRIYFSSKLLRIHYWPNWLFGVWESKFRSLSIFANRGFFL